MLPRRAVIFLALAWILVMLYPDPGVLLRSIRNTVRPQIQPQAVAAIARRLPNDPKAIEAYVLDKQVPYAYDWQSAGVPWYFPTTAEAVRAGQGDCESRAVVLASILTAKGIPNSLRMSFNHIWVDYPGKQSNALENAGVQFAGSENGHFFIHWPKDFQLGQEISDQVAIFVDAGARVACAAPLRRAFARRALERARPAARRRPAGRRRPAAGRPSATPPPVLRAARPCAGARRPLRDARGRAARLTAARPRRRSRSPPGLLPAARCDTLSRGSVPSAEEAP